MVAFIILKQEANAQMTSMNISTEEVCKYDCVKEGVFLEDQEMLAGDCRLSREVLKAVASVGIYSPNKDLVGDTRAGCASTSKWILSVKRQQTAVHHETLLLPCMNVTLYVCLF